MKEKKMKALLFFLLILNRCIWGKNGDVLLLNQNVSFVLKNILKKVKTPRLCLKG